MEPKGGRLRQHVIDKSALTRTRDPTDDSEQTDGENRIDLAKIVGGRSSNNQLPPTGILCLGILFHTVDTGQERTGTTFIRRQALLHRTGKYNMTALSPGPGTDLEQVVRRQQSVGIMLHHHHGVAPISQAEQDVEQATMVRRMQTDAGLVKCVGNPDQPHAQLCSQTRPLGLATAQGAVWTIQV